jgi:hypothetical protein
MKNMQPIQNVEFTYDSQQRISPALEEIGAFIDAPLYTYLVGHGSPSWICCRDNLEAGNPDHQVSV